MIRENIERLLAEIPEGVELAAAAKARSPAEIEEAIGAGVRVIGENYVQEALAVHERVSRPARWHFIGHLQTNKARKIVEIFDMIQTVDSLRLARETDKRCRAIGKVMPILIEVNSGREPQKGGVLPEEAVELIEGIAPLPNLRIEGLMTMGPLTGDPELARPYFVETRRLFDEIGGLDIPGVEMKVLSMGMTNSYRLAIEEGSTLIRIGTEIFGPRG